ncbi:TolC family protein [Novosphingobium sp.]|uniref:TolC family protein n=1 Tax=Novosphingobium sp. TaxID=1874826 RepID=UPI00333F39DF
MKRLAPGLVVMLAACTAGPDYRPPAPLPASQIRLQESLANGAVTPSPLPDTWWQLFNDAELDRLIARALANNTDLRIAAANLQRARALFSGAGAARLPTTDGTAQYSRSRSVTTGQPVTTDYFALGFDASYEVDLFGGVSRSIEAARADAGAAQAAVDAARVAVVAETARAYAQACGYGAQADVARETETLQSRTFDLTHRRQDAGRGTRSEVDQAQVLVEQARAQVPVFEAERRAALYALAVLTGDPPAMIADTPAAQCHAVPLASEPLPVGDGQALLARRPDVRQAERTLAADTARIGVATAALYPSVTLLGGIKLGSANLGDIGKSASFGYSLGPLISWNFPLNGAARARVRENRAIADGSLARFDGTVLTALKEAEQALARAGGATLREAALRRAVTASSDAARLSRIRFDNGADSFLQLLDTERQRASARAALAQAEAERADAQISVFKALGGGW